MLMGSVAFDVRGRRAEAAGPAGVGQLLAAPVSLLALTLLK